MNKIAFNHILAAFKRIVALNAAFLILMSVYRFVFFLYYRTPGTVQGMYGYLAKAFYMGVRFDLVIVAYINTLVTVTLLLVWLAHRESIFHAWLAAVKYYYAVMYSLVFVILSVDFGFYSYFRNHINILIFGIFEDDTKALFSTLGENYNLFLVGAGFAALIALIYFICRYFMQLPEETVMPVSSARPVRIPAKIVFALVLLSANVMAARGSFGLFPLGIMDAEISPDDFINKLGVNSFFTLQQAIEFRMKENKNYDLAKDLGYDGKEGISRALSDYLGPQASRTDGDVVAALTRHTPRNPGLERLHPNVVVIVMEGFGTHLMRQYNTPDFNVLGELKKHFDQDTLFLNFLPGDMGTIGSLESVLMSFPKRPNAKPLTQSKYAFHSYPSGAALPYQRAGYETVFLYGGNAGWRDLPSFVPRLGFDRLQGEGSMDPRYRRNQWGVYDEHLFDAIYRSLAENNGKPKFIMALSTSNHPPYSLPPDYKALPLNPSPELNAKMSGDRVLAKGRFETYQYACQKVGEFITRIKQSPLRDSTIIAITGDHNFWSVFDYSREEFLDRDGVPLYLYIPDALKPQTIDTAVYGSHIDIMPTLYHLSLSNVTYVSLGRDLLDPGAGENMTFNIDGIALSKEGASGLRPDSGQSMSFAWDPAAPHRLVVANETEAHRRLIRKYKAALAITDHYITHLYNPPKKGRKINETNNSCS